MVKFSVLLPTRNGGRFLSNAISSILEQPYDDLELVVSDNANTDETQEVIASFSKDPRLKVVRFEEPVPVTENWNHTLYASSGDYVLMIGDDDFVLPGYFDRAAEVVEKYNHPDCITYNAYVFVAPDSINGNMESYCRDSLFEFGSDFNREGLLPREFRFGIVRDMYRFYARIPLNMQTTLFSRQKANQISGGVFQPPFPDHYGLNALLLEADSWVYLPERLLVVGVSPKSFGHFVYTHQPDHGMAYLGIVNDIEGKLPGNELLNCMYQWLNRLKLNYRAQLEQIEINRPAYVRKQIYWWYVQYKGYGLPFKRIISYFRMLSFKDWLGLFLSVVDLWSWKLLWRALKSNGDDRFKKMWSGLRPMEKVSNIKAYADTITRGRSSLDVKNADEFK